ncbi:MAG: hypothetical protein ABGY96_08160 [bacterium]
MSSLILFDEIEGDTRRSLNYLAQINFEGRKTNVDLVNLTDLPIDRIQRIIPFSPDQLTYTEGFDLYSKLDEDFNRSLAMWLESLTQITPAFWHLEYSRLSELNFSTSLLRNLRKVFLIQYIIDERRPTELIYIGNHTLGRWLTTNFKDKSIRIFVLPTTNCLKRAARSFFVYCRTILLFLSNLLSELTLLILCRIFLPFSTPLAQATGAIGVYALYPRNWEMRDGKNKHRYSSDLFNHCPTRNHYYLISLLRTNSDALNRFWSGVKSMQSVYSTPCDAPFRILEQYGSFRDLAACYLNLNNLLKWLRSAKHAQKMGCWKYCNISIEALIQPIILNVFREIPKNMYTERCGYRAAISITPATMIIPVFELLEGRFITKSHKSAEIQTVGLQHGILYSLQIPRAISSLATLERANYSDLIPHLIGVEGAAIESQFLNFGFEPSRIRTVGAPRLTNLIIAKRSTLEKQKSRHADLVIFGDLYSSFHLFSLAIQLSGTFVVVFKSHPTLTLSKDFRSLMSETSHSPKFKVTNLPVTDLIATHKPIAALSCMSGAGLDALRLGIPLIFYPSNRYPLLNPLLSTKGTIPALQTVAAVSEELLKLKTDFDYWNMRRNSGSTCLINVVSEVGDQACRNVMRLIDLQP